MDAMARTRVCGVAGPCTPEVVRLGAIGRSADLLQELLTGDQVPAMSSQDFSELPLGWREPDLVAAVGESFGCEIDGARVGGDERSVVTGLGPWQHGTYPRNRTSMPNGLVR